MKISFPFSAIARKFAAIVSKQINKVSFANLVIALGIIYGDIGTSPLYVLNAIIHGRVINEELILGSLSCIIWTLTLQTTIKYVWLTLKADNKGEGGIFSLYALVRRQKRWLVIPAMLGGAALLADGMITPPISVTSAIEGLRQMPAFRYIDQSTIVYLVIGILVILFFLQQFGTESIGKLFGPIMFIWFSMLAVLGFSHLTDDLYIFKALSPHYAIQLLTNYPKGFWILGAVFIDPYLRPLYDALDDMIPADKLGYYMSTRTIEIAPLAYMRGRTLDNAFIILDEAQNATDLQIKMFLTRIGANAKAIITGDLTQIDLPKNQKSGLAKALYILQGIDGIAHIELDEEDVVRHRLVKAIIKAYEKDKKEEDATHPGR